MQDGMVKEYQELLRLVVDHGAHPVLVVDETDTIQITNPAADRLFESAAEDLVGRPLPFPVSEGHPTCHRLVEAEDASWTAEMLVQPATLHGRSLYVVSLRDTRERSFLNSVLQEASLTDRLTGLLNRRGFMVLTEQQIKLADRSGRGLILLLATVQNLDHIRAMHGDPKGDTAIRQASLLASRVFRDSDIIGRVDEDTFAVTAVEAHPDSGGILLARLRDRFWEFNAHGTEDYQLSVAGAAARYQPAHPCSAETLLARADAALEENRCLRGPTADTA
jgi:diguanylate cyclase (GGDEF)-like protein